MMDASTITPEALTAVYDELARIDYQLAHVYEKVAVIIAGYEERLRALERTRPFASTSEASESEDAAPTQAVPPPPPPAPRVPQAHSVFQSAPRRLEAPILPSPRGAGASASSSYASFVPHFMLPQVHQIVLPVAANIAALRMQIPPPPTPIKTARPAPYSRRPYSNARRSLKE